MKEENINNLIQNNNWKNKNEQYLFELQKFMDLADNIENENLKKFVSLNNEINDFYGELASTYGDVEWKKNI